MTWERWVCPHGFETGFFPVPGKPNLIEHRSCGICCEEISEHISRLAAEPSEVTVRRERDEEWR